LYSQFEPADHAYSFRGINPVKLPHVAALTPDPQRLMAFYIDELGFRLSDSARDFFFFLRCGADHHTINLLSGDHAGLQHFAFEVADVSHLQRPWDELIRRGERVMWGPIRHGIGHILSIYFHDPEGQIIELCTQLDRMSNEELGYFDPRPYHEDRPQRPKRWDSAHQAGAV
jgi:catechol 2,3-dioxygenase-like lactoylglutathione lyase family enzyme